MNIQDAWIATCERLADDLGKDVFNNWIKNLTLTGMDAGTVRFMSENAFTANHTKKTYGDKILGYLSQQTAGVKRIVISSGAVKKSSATGEQRSSYYTGEKFHAATYYRAAIEASPARGTAQAILIIMTVIASWEQPTVTFTKAQLVAAGLGVTCAKSIRASLRQLRDLGVIECVRGQQGGKGVPTTYKINIVQHVSQRVETDLLAFYKSAAKERPK